eukprot:GHVO01054116.1.p1 GENE.GHVO01054116.1~~GHVO01054116.1.p1  ORF type:complete len:571 (-),score=114.90 GHVO01054116.1:109-1821(-)
MPKDPPPPRSYSDVGMRLPGTGGGGGACENRTTAAAPGHGRILRLGSFKLPPFPRRKKRAKIARAEVCRHDLGWAFARLNPHTPNFGLQPKSELQVSVDAETGLYVAGYVPQWALAKVGGGMFQPISKKKRLKEKKINELSDLTIKVIPYQQLHVQNLEEKFGVGEALGEEFDIETATMTESRTVANMPEMGGVELDPVGWFPTDEAGTPDVLLYIHGYNNNHVESLQGLGQMAAFGNFPNHLKIYLLTWPAGKSFAQFYMARNNAEDTRSHEALHDLLRAFRDNGVRNLHIMCHSMGSRLFLKAFRRITSLLHPYADGAAPDQHEYPSPMENETSEEEDGGESPFPPPHVIPGKGRRTISSFGQLEMNYQGSISEESAGVNNSKLEDNEAKLRLISVTLLNPEYFLDEFVHHDFPLIRSYCNHITVFADTNDKALSWSQFFSRRNALGKNAFGLRLDPEDMGVSERERNRKPTPLRYMNTVSFFRVGPQRQFHDYEWLDLDVIDTTFMDQNVHSLRHSFWNLNREIIEDLRELLLTRKRARQRTQRLDRRDGNVWVYRVAPSHVTSIYA